MPEPIPGRPRRWDRLYIFLAATYLAEGFSGVAYEPISYLLKNDLHLSAGQSAMFVWWMTFPFLIKPLFGFLSDLIPIGGMRRKPQIMIASGAAAAAWAILARMHHYDYGLVLALLVLVNVGMCSSDVVCEAVMVEQGQKDRATGVYQAVKVGALYAALVATGIGGGWLYAHVSLRLIFAMTALFTLMIFAGAAFSRERDFPAKGTARLAILKPFLSDRRFWVLGAVVFLWSFYPFLGTAQFYYQSEVLKFGPVFIGFLGTLSGVLGVAAAALYARVAGRVWSTERLVKGAVLFGCPLSLLFVFYLGPASVIAVTVVWGLVGVFFRLALLDLAAQFCPPYAEATAFAVYMAAFDFAEAGSNAVGGRLYDWLQAVFARMPHPAYAAVVALSAVGACCTLSCWWLLPYLNFETAAREAPPASIFR